MCVCKAKDTEVVHWSREFVNLSVVALRVYLLSCFDQDNLLLGRITRYNIYIYVCMYMYSASRKCSYPHINT